MPLFSMDYPKTSHVITQYATGKLLRMPHLLLQYYYKIKSFKSFLTYHVSRVLTFLNYTNIPHPLSLPQDESFLFEDKLQSLASKTVQGCYKKNEFVLCVLKCKSILSPTAE